MSGAAAAAAAASWDRLPTPQRPLSYSHVPSFRFSTPPRAAYAPALEGSSGESAWLASLVCEDPENLHGAPGSVLHKPPSSLALEGSFASTMSADDTSLTTDECPDPGRSREKGPPSAPVPPEVLATMAEAFEEMIEETERPEPGVSGFRWTGVLDAAAAAWIGGTRMLRYGELLPGGLMRALDLLLEGEECEGSDGSEPPPGYTWGGSSSAAAAEPKPGRASGQLVLELGMGRGRAALQLFLLGATVIGVELASERYHFAVAALERLAHRYPEQFEISKRTSRSVRIRKVGGPKGALCEVRLGNFFEAVKTEEVEAATMVFMQVCLPQPAWSRLRSLLLCTQANCRIMLYEELRKVWEGHGPPFQSLGSPLLACTWSPERGHRFHCYKRISGGVAAGGSTPVYGAASAHDGPRRLRSSSSLAN